MAMAALVVRHGRVVLCAPRGAAPRTVAAVGAFATKAEKKKGIDRKKTPLAESAAMAIAAKGFLRPQKDYSPPADLHSKLETIFKKVAGNASPGLKFEDLDQKFKICLACAQEFNHSIPSSMLHAVETLNDVSKFYETPVNTVTPLDKMRNMELPENLHVQFEYLRFHPETDTKFKGQTAFNRSSTLVTGLKYKGKYKGHIQNQQWPFNS